MYQVQVFMFFKNPEVVFRHDSVFYARVPVVGDHVFHSLYYNFKTIIIIPLVTRVSLHASPQPGERVAAIHVCVEQALTPELSSQLLCLGWVDHT